MILKVPSNPNHSVILCFYDSIIYTDTSLWLLLLYLVSELEILSFVPFVRSFLAQQDQGKCILAEMRIAEEKPLKKTDTEKQVPDVQTKPDDASFLWGNCSRTVNPYENMVHNTNKVNRDMESAPEMLGMCYFYINIV